MLLAALVDLGAPLERVRELVHGLGLERVRIHTKEASPAGLRARQIDVIVGGELADRANVPPEAAAQAEAHAKLAGEYVLTGKVVGAKAPHGHRRYVDIRALLERGPLPERTRALSLRAFAALAEAEALAHGVAPDDVEFHEVGADDAITDIVGVCASIELLGVDEVIVSPVPIARGLTRGAHGPIPLPGPATLHLLAGAPLLETPLAGELVTPTGAALLRVIGDRFGPIPSMTLERVGVGAGHKSWPDRPNVIRALLGTRARPTAVAHAGERIIETSLDDMSPQHFAALERALFSAGAADVWSSEIQMKKGRAARLVSALVEERLSEAVIAAFFAHSTTLGVRITPVERRRAERRMIEVETPYGAVRVKLSPRPVGPELAMPEHDDCEARASERGVPVRAVWEAALLAARGRA